MSTKEQEEKKQIEENSQEKKGEESKAEASKVVPNSAIVEAFGQPDLVEVQLEGELKLWKNLKWTIWEQVDFPADKQDKQKDQKEVWAAKLRKVAWFDNLIQFHQAWNAIPHSKVSNLLLTDASNHFKQFTDEMGDYQVAALQMFQTGIRPEWEDERNKKGGEFRIELQNCKSDEILQKLWESVIFDLITGQCPCADTGVAGVRLVQKAKGGSLQGFRFELWLLDNDESCEINKEIKTYVQTRIQGEVLKGTPYESTMIKWDTHDK